MRITYYKVSYLIRITIPPQYDHATQFHLKKLIIDCFQQNIIADLTCISGHFASIVQFLVVYWTDEYFMSQQDH